MKTNLELRPVYHRLEDRIRAHVLLCWLALLLIRITENTTDQTWHHLRDDLQNSTSARLRGPRRDLPATHRTHPHSTRHLHQAGDRPTHEDHRASPGSNALTNMNTTP
jgi:hypothetical protein